MATRTNFIASIEEDSIKDIEDIASELVAIGCKIDNILTIIGIISGSTSSDVTTIQSKIPGIKNVEVDRKLKSNKNGPGYHTISIRLS